MLSDELSTACPAPRRDSRPRAKAVMGLIIDNSFCTCVAFLVAKTQNSVLQVSAAEDLHDEITFPKVGKLLLEAGKLKVQRFTRICTPTSTPLQMKLVVQQN